MQQNLFENKINVGTKQYFCFKCFRAIQEFKDNTTSNALKPELKQNVYFTVEKITFPINVQ